MSYADQVFIQNCKDILSKGVWDTGRPVRPKWEDGTPAHTIKLFGVVNRYDLKKEFPIITIRRQYLKSAVDELLWIWQKKSNNIHDLNSHVWDAWADENGSIGKAYGYQLGVKHHYPQGDMDQVDKVLWDLKHDPGSRRILTNLYEDLRKDITFQFDTAVTAIRRDGAGYCLETADGDEYAAPFLIAAPGRSGAEWFANQCKELGLELLNNQVDIGVRVELPASVFEHITDVVYESKLVYRTKQYGDQVRTFCMNPYGHVVAENVEGINTVNGHSYADPKLRSENTNFALLVSNRFTQPFNEPYRYGKHIASLSNMLAGGVLVQRFGDLVKGVRTNEHRLSKSFTRPTLTAAVPGDLSLALPKRQLDDIIEMIYVLDKIAPGTANHDTLLYGAEVKFYSARLKLSEELETAIPNFFAAGDGAGVTRGLAQAGASGVQAARAILKRLS